MNNQNDEFDPYANMIADQNYDLQVPQEKTAAMGFINGAVPMAGILAGAGKAGMDAITGVRGPLAGGTLSDLADDFNETRDAYNQDSEQAALANPGTNKVAEVAGVLMPGSVSGEVGKAGLKAIAESPIGRSVGSMADKVSKMPSLKDMVLEAIKKNVSPKASEAVIKSEAPAAKDLVSQAIKRKYDPFTHKYN